MPNLIHIGEVAALMFVAYQLAWFVGFVLRRAVSPRKTAPVAAAAVAVAEPSVEAPVRTPVIAPIPAMPPAPTAAGPNSSVELPLAKVEGPVAAPDLRATTAAIPVDVRPPLIPTASDADVTPPPVPLSPDFLAELQSAMLESNPPEEPSPPDPRTSAAVTAAFEEAFELTPVPPEPESEVLEPDLVSDVVPLASSADVDEPGLFDLPLEEPVLESQPGPLGVPELDSPPTAIDFEGAPLQVIPTPPVLDLESATTEADVAAIDEVLAPAREPVPELPSISPSPLPSSKDAMPVAPMAPATQPAMIATNIPVRPAPLPTPTPEVALPLPPEPAPPPEGPAPMLKPASKPGEAWSGRSAAPKPRNDRPAGILRPPGASRNPPQGYPQARPAAPAPSARPASEVAAAVAAAAAKVQQVVAAAADYDDGIEASDEDAEAAAMRAIEGGWIRRATPRTTKPDRPEGVPPAPPKKR